MKFSVLLPTRNRLDLLARAIATVRRQDYDDWEIIVSDNHSEEDVAGYILSLGESRIKYYRTESFIPVTDNWNNALEKSDGDYVIMLGDDDCLMKGYFSTMNNLVEKFDAPDFLYTGAFLYAYPGVFPEIPDGFLREYRNREIFQSANEPFLLEKQKAIDFVKDSLNFRVTFDYNMQFSLVSRNLIEKMKCYGQFYQSPYPDYYASNAMMLKAKRIIIVPKPLVTIGISPKSFGFYYFNDAEKDGNEFLNNLPDPSIMQRLKSVIMPGTVMNTSWLISMDTLAVNYDREFSIAVNYDRYRHIQSCIIYEGLIMGKKSAKQEYRQLKGKICHLKWIFFWLLSTIASLAPKRYRNYLAHRVSAIRDSHPKLSMPTVTGKFHTILDVYEQVDPNGYESDYNVNFMERG